MLNADNLTTILGHCHVIWGNLNFLEPSGPLQACNGTDLPSISVITTEMIKKLLISTCFDYCSIITIRENFFHSAKLDGLKAAILKLMCR